MAHRVQIDTSCYERSHTTPPRGRGGWLFSEHPDCPAEQPMFCFSGTYTEARRAAVAFARERGLARLFVCP